MDKNKVCHKTWHQVYCYNAVNSNIRWTWKPAAAVCNALICCSKSGYCH